MHLLRLELKCGWPIGTRVERGLTPAVARGLWLAMLVALVGGCDEKSSPTGPTPTTVTIRGHLLDYRSGAALSNAALGFVSETPGFETQVTTDAVGSYAATLPTAAPLVVRVDALLVGMIRVGTAAHRGDLFVDRTTCVSRYGVIIDARTLRPVPGATVSLTGTTVTTASDGWYRIDLGCPDEIPFPGGTTVISVSASGYRPRAQVVGRGVQGVNRLDIDLEKS
jgi:hypothetical protein